MTRGSQCLKSQINEQLASGIKYRQKRLQLKQEHYSELMKVDGLGPYFVLLILKQTMIMPWSPCPGIGYSSQICPSEESSEPRVAQAVVSYRAMGRGERGLLAIQGAGGIARC